MHRETFIDAATSGGAISLPFWVQSFNIAAQEVLIIGGIILLALRIALAFRAWRRRTFSALAETDNSDDGSAP